MYCSNRTTSAKMMQMQYMVCKMLSKFPGWHDHLMEFIQSIYKDLHAIIYFNLVMLSVHLILSKLKHPEYHNFIFHQYNI